MGVNTFVAETDAGPLAGWECGSGPDLLLLHGGPGMSDTMDTLVPETVGWRAIGYQQRGLAPSVTDGPFTVDQHVADAIAVMDRLGIVQSVVAGHSWGGFLALMLAVKHPERVSGLLLIDSLGVIGPDGGSAELGRELDARLTEEARSRLREVTARLAGSHGTDADVAETLRLRWPGYFADPQSAPAFPADLACSLRAATETFGDVIALIEVGAVAARVPQVEVPAVVLAGELSPFPRYQIEQLAARLARAELVVVPAAGHLPWHEQPGSVASALARLGHVHGGVV